MAGKKEPLFFMSNLLIRRVIRQNLVLLLLMNILNIYSDSAKVTVVVSFVSVCWQ